MARSPLLACLGLVACTGPTPALSPSAAEPAPIEGRAPVGPTREEALERRVLLRASSFTSARINYGGDLSLPVAAYRLVLAAPDAGPTFRRLLDEASPAGRLYALCGLFEVDPAAAATLGPRLVDDATRVETQGGCLVGESSLGELARGVLADGDERAWRLKDLRGEVVPGRPVEPQKEPVDWRAVLEDLAGLDAAIGAGPPTPWRPGDPDDALDRVASHLADDPLRPAREQLVARLAERGPKAYADLVRAQAHPSWIVRLVAVSALASLEEPWGLAVGDEVVAALGDPDVRVRWVAALDASESGAAPAPLLRALGRPGEEPELLVLALRGLRWAEPDSELVRGVSALLGHPQRAVRVEAARRLARSGAAVAPALPLLQEALLGWSEEDALVALAAIVELEAGVAGPALVEPLLEAEGGVQVAIAEALGGLGEAGATALDEALRRSAPDLARTLESTRAPSDRVALLEAALEAEPARAARLAAVLRLGREGLLGVQVLTHLFAWGGQDGGLARLAGSALRHAGPDGVSALARSPDPAGDRLAASLVEWLLGRDRDRLAMLRGLDFAPPGPQVEEVFLTAIDRWLFTVEHDRRAPALDRVVWEAALSVLLRWDTPGARPLVARFAERAPSPEVRARAARGR